MPLNQELARYALYAGPAVLTNGIGEDWHLLARRWNDDAGYAARIDPGHPLAFTRVQARNDRGLFQCPRLPGTMGVREFVRMPSAGLDPNQDSGMLAGVLGAGSWPDFKAMTAEIYTALSPLLLEDWSRGRAILLLDLHRFAVMGPGALRTPRSAVRPRAAADLWI